MRQTRGAIFDITRLDDGRVQFKWSKYNVTFSPAPRGLFNIIVYRDEQAVEYRPQFWGAPNRINALRLLEHAIEKLKTA